MMRGLFSRGAGRIAVDGAQERGRVERERLHLGVSGAQLRASGDRRGGRLGAH